MAGEILSIVIADDTPIDPQSSIGASGSGWVAIVKLAGITSLVGTAVPSALTISVTDPGYTTTGSTTTVSRTITGVAHMRRQEPNGNTKMVSTDGTDLTLYITLDDYIYAGTTLVSASIGSTFYPSCTASSASTRTNSSTITYASIKPKFAWLNIQLERATGSTRAVEAVAFHRYARVGQQVACVKYYVTDGTNTSADVLVSSPTLSALQTKGNIAEVWAGSVDMSAQTQGGVSTVIAKVYPWIGDSTGVLNLSTDGYAWPTSLPMTPLRVLCDRTGGYGGAFAYVDGVGAGTPTVSATAATAKANPFATITDAANAIRTWNNTNKGHNDYGGAAIRLLDNAGADKTYTLSTATDNWPGSTHLVIEKDPASSAVVTLTTGSGFNWIPETTLFRNLRIVSGASSRTLIMHGGARNILAVDNCVCDNTANTYFASFVSLTYWRNCTFQGANRFTLVDGGGNLSMLVGCIASGSAPGPENYPQPRVRIGCNIPQAQHDINTISEAADGMHGMVIYNNRLSVIKLNTYQSATTIAYGVAVVQNMVESYSAGAAALHLFADGDLTTIQDIIDQHNTAVGERSSRYYNDVAGSAVVPSGTVKRGISRANINDNTNQKTDYANAGAGSVGTWAYAYGVGNAGNVNLFGTVARANDRWPTNDGSENYLGEAWLPSSMPNLFHSSLGFTQAQIMDMFVNYTATPRAVPAPGGNYQPLATSTYLLSRVPTGLSMLGKDLNGVARRTDGTGAAGAYEVPAPASSAGMPIGGNVALGSLLTGVAGVTGTLAAVDATNVVAISGGVSISGSVSVTDAKDLTAITGTTSISGAITSTQAANTGNLTGGVAVSGTLARTQAANTAVLAGGPIAGGSIAVTQTSNTASASGAVAVSGTLAATQAAGTASITGNVAAAGTISGTIASTKSPNSGALAGAVTAAGTLGAAQAQNTLAGVGGVIAAGAAASTQAANTGALSGASLVAGTISAQQATGTAAIAGTVGAAAITGSIASTQAANSASVTGAVSVSGALTSTSAKNASALAGAVAISGSVSATQPPNVMSATAVNGAGVTISNERANLIYELALLHGLVPGSPLTVTATSRSAGALAQTISGTSPVTISTVASDVLQGSVDTWIDALAAVHGLTAPLVVTSTSRSSGALTQTFSTVGTTTTVTTP